MIAAYLVILTEEEREEPKASIPLAFVSQNKRAHFPQGDVNRKNKFKWILHKQNYSQIEKGGKKKSVKTP